MSCRRWVPSAQAGGAIRLGQPAGREELSRQADRRSLRSRPPSRAAAITSLPSGGSCLASVINCGLKYRQRHRPRQTEAVCLASAHRQSNRPQKRIPTVVKTTHPQPVFQQAHRELLPRQETRPAGGSQRGALVWQTRYEAKLRSTPCSNSLTADRTRAGHRAKWLPPTSPPPPDQPSRGYCSRTKGRDVASD